MTSTGGHLRNATRVVDAAAAVIAGVLGCLAADLVITRFVAHSHGVAHGVAAGVRHVHDQDAASAIVVGALLATAVLTAVAALRRRADRSAVRWVSGLSILSFVAGQLVAVGPEGPSSAPVLIVGGLVHVLVGAGAGLLCWRWLERAYPAGTGIRPRSRRQVYVTAQLDRGVRLFRRRWLSPLVGRAPPAVFG
ncbi:hypothetical protein KZZ52_14270 [Dactylosporangium sp. AC04546]|uniref:hypothetical protein n=1 Tax=Dactylosporangium sp. AC04546 TaxID=2862460 RepID=UPI001EE0068B|nr:hypothetical protein [Dactylosporangium sp. AC04546]WVK89903.1 hypothetical protein KZZ52_14270 [Dactylosporangium sp. AC04546]